MKIQNTLSKDLDAVNSGAEKSKKRAAGLPGLCHRKITKSLTFRWDEAKRSERIVALPALTAQLRESAQDKARRGSLRRRGSSFVLEQNHCQSIVKHSLPLHLYHIQSIE